MQFVCRAWKSTWMSMGEELGAGPGWCLIALLRLPLDYAGVGGYLHSPYITLLSCLILGSPVWVFKGPPVLLLPLMGCGALEARALPLLGPLTCEMGVRLAPRAAVKIE